MIPVGLKVGAAAWLAWELLHDDSSKTTIVVAPEPTKPTEPVKSAPVPSPTEPTPKPTEPSVPAPTKPVEPACAAGPTLGKRWIICGKGTGPFGVEVTQSRGDYDALYSATTGWLVAIVDNTTYRVDGDLMRPVTSAWVAAMPVTVQGIPVSIKTASEAVAIGYFDFPWKAPGWRG